MSRTKGAKDKQPRKVHRERPGHESISVRIYGPKLVVRWFKKLDTKKRGLAIANVSPL